MGEETLGSWGRPADKPACDKRGTGYTRFPLRFARSTRYARGRRSLVDARGVAAKKKGPEAADNLTPFLLSFPATAIKGL